MKRPRFLVMENVKNLVSEKFRPLFLQWEKTLRDMGYTNFTQVLNAKDYGVPQNRERVFCVSVLDGWYEFPHREVLRKCLGNVLEDEVAEKYYLSEKLIAGFLKHNENHRAKGTGFISKPKQPDDCANAIRANAAICPTDNTVIVQRPRGFNKGGGHAPKIALEDYAIRRLTPRECFRLMGVSEQNIDAIQAAGISDSQQYKMAGNSIVVDVLAKIFQQLFKFNEL